MTRTNGTVTSGYTARDGRFIHYVKLDAGGTLPCAWPTALPESRRVRVEDGEIREAGE